MPLSEINCFLPERSDLNHTEGVPEMPNRKRRRLSRMEWSTVPNAAQRSMRRKRVTCCIFMVKRLTFLPSRVESAAL